MKKRKHFGSFEAAFVVISVGVVLILEQTVGMLMALVWVTVVVMVSLVVAVGLKWQQRRGRREVLIDDPCFHQFLLNQLDVLRPLGFFTSSAGPPDASLAEQLEGRIRDEIGGAVGELMEYPALIAILDENRVWSGAMQRDWFKGNDLYVELLNDWAHISRGFFQPQNVREEWNDDGTEVRVVFTLDDRECVLLPEVKGNWLDPDLPTKVNKLWQHPEYRFRHFDTPWPELMSVVVLNDAEADTLFWKDGW